MQQSDLTPSVFRTSHYKEGESHQEAYTHRDRVNGHGMYVDVARRSLRLMPKDGELAFPSNYKSYPTFFAAIQKPNAVRDVYINKTGANAQQGQQFANGSILVMEIHKAQKGADGNFAKGSDGKLIKAGLVKVFVMQKGHGWGKHAPTGFNNGDWIYSAFTASGERLDVDYKKCRGCHMPLGEAKNYVHRYDEYFNKRG